MTTNTWIPLDYLTKKLNDRTWFWCGSGDASDLKYVSIYVDTRDNHCTLSDRNGKLIASTIKELDKLFKKLEKDNGNLTFKAAKAVMGIK